MKNNNFLAVHWWAVVLRGLLALGLGLVFVVWPGKSLLTVVALAGLFMVLDGIIASILGVLSVKKDDKWWILLFQGLLGVLLGLVLFNWPRATIGLLFFVLALWIVVSGVMTLVLAVAMRKESYGNWTVTAIGILGILFGMFLFSYPEQTIRVLVVVLGLFMLVSGVMGVALGLDLRRVEKDFAKI